ncbi:ABC transporter permease [Nakamurella alba]|uniref:ABC transporter permease n=1 Tax=Nakamurella alba TaxID=2665158 RepID=UPI002AC364B7|nr:ABC transporter permease [Nakamurella alba]
MRTGSPAAQGFRESAYRVGALVRHNLLIRRRDPGQFISYLVMPMILMLVLKPIYVRVVDRGEAQVVTGLLVMFSVFAVAIAGNSILSERQWKTWDRLRVTRASTTELLLGKTIPVYLLMVVQQVFLLVYGCAVIGLGFPPAPGLLLLAVLLWAFTLLALGTALATVARSLGELGVISDVSALVVSSLGGALVPIAIMPGWAQAAAHASPGYWALEMLQSALAGEAGGMLWPAVILLALGAVAAVFAVRRLARGWGRTHLL